MLRLDRPVWLQHGPVRGPHDEIDVSKIDSHPPEHFDHLGLENDTAAPTGRGASVQDVNVPADLTHKGP
jgi:hypothetical protein